MILLLKLLEKFKGEGRKVLIFSQFVIMLDLMKPHLERRGYVCEILKGSQSSTIRNQSIERFNH
jgi:chromodomain-helicase-DNA-binding protein 7